MITLTLSQTDNGSTAVAVSCNIVYGSDFWDETLNQEELLTVDGVDVVQDSGGPIITHGVLMLKNLSYADGIALMGWLRSNIKFAYNRFSISAVTNTDLGKGKNTIVTNCRYDGGQTMNGIFSFTAPGIFSVNFPYRFVR